MSSVFCFLCVCVCFCVFSVSVFCEMLRAVCCYVAVRLISMCFAVVSSFFCLLVLCGRFVCFCVECDSCFV